MLIDHARFCGVIPESYGHDSSEEKLYSKYTDVLLAVAFRALEFDALVLTERAGVADVEVFADPGRRMYAQPKIQSGFG